MSLSFETLPLWIGWSVRVEAGDALLEAEVTRPAGARGLVLMPHEERDALWHRSIADVLHSEGLATLLFKPGPRERRQGSMGSAFHQEDAAFLAQRYLEVEKWSEQCREVQDLPCTLFGADVAATAALMAAIELGTSVRAVISAAGRPDWIAPQLTRLKSPTLLITGGLDSESVSANRSAYRGLQCPKALCIIPGAGHDLDEPGAVEEVGELTATWIRQHLGVDA
jgi:putative phosphoribosyl transferase